MLIRATRPRSRSWRAPRARAPAASSRRSSAREWSACGRGKVIVHDPDASGTTSTDARRRRRMVERQLRRRGISTTSACCAAMAEVPRELFVPEEQRRQRLPRRRAAHRRGPDDLAALDRGLHDLSCSSCDGDERVLEVGTGFGLRGRGPVPLLPRGGHDRAPPSLRRGPRRRCGSSATRTSRCAIGDGSRGAPDRAPFDGISVTATAAGEPSRRSLEQLAPGGGSSARCAATARAPDALPRRQRRRRWCRCASCR